MSSGNLPCERLGLMQHPLKPHEWFVLASRAPGCVPTRSSSADITALLHLRTWLVKFFRNGLKIL